MSGEMFEGYAVIEMMGHRKLSGRVTPVEGFGGLLRLEVPGIEQPIIIGSGAIFQITPVSEAFARERAEDYLRQSAYYSAQHLLALLPEEKQPALVAETPREIGIDYEVDEDDEYEDFDDLDDDDFDEDYDDFEDDDLDVGFYRSIMVDASDPVPGDGAYEEDRQGEEADIGEADQSKRDELLDTGDIPF